MPATHRRKLPIGIQTFSDIREGGYYYVDKTPFNPVAKFSIAVPEVKDVN